MRGSHSQNGVSTAQNETAQTDVYASYPSSGANAPPPPPGGRLGCDRFFSYIESFCGVKGAFYKKPPCVSFPPLRKAQKAPPKGSFRI